MLWRELRLRYDEYFEGGMGAEYILKLLDRIDAGRAAAPPAGGSTMPRSARQAQDRRFRPQLSVAQRRWHVAQQLGG